ncbi:MULTISPECIES: hypothetical protein [unclassified Novosphingobium]|uniref:hypothetical protein n=1 Tax=unclassified Novosphingobium TaxID=2644732 RepID=UPI000D316A64|nr:MULTISPECIES: hypothetical protein [unclassified Novosphingobium]PTR11776.1 hypothetical protein C8K11_104135 [Novosphingobium sp. GV055]PUB04816.1 hypothetical protein C8K12_104135 [Novosphingobium sp. GV061]PUB21135.1 hypothetical protein C8K14_104135 [Novosphingobium sp. GV079]PUB42861.1 hypothetical protein C8K10_104135 [Novosphingobium sp. GV027]
MSGENTAWIKVADQEAEALAQLLATNGRCVMVIVIGAESDPAGSTYVLHAAAGNTKGAHLRQFIAGVERKLEWLKSKLVRRG